MANYRNWLELPCDVTLTILMKVPQSYILESVQFVCKPWYDLCKDPSMWLTIELNDLRKPKIDLGGRAYESYETAGFIRCNKKPKLVVSAKIDRCKMILNAIDRSAGGLIGLDVQAFYRRGLCSYLASQYVQLKRLQLVCCEISSEEFIQGLPKLSFLYELEFSLCRFPSLQPKKIISLIKSCPPSVKTFKFNGHYFRRQAQVCDEMASTIAENMPQLCHLQLVGNNLSNVGLRAILDRCSRLQSLDLRACPELNLEGDLGKRLSNQVTDLKLPNKFNEEHILIILFR